MSSPIPVASAPIPLKKRIRKSLVRTGHRMVEAAERGFGRISLIGDTEIIDRKHFPWVERLEANWTTIRRELEAVLADRNRLPNIQDISPTQRYLTKDDGWKTYFLYAYGHKAEASCRRCPETTKLIEEIPELVVAFFSILSPGKHIPAHKGAYKGVIRSHLGLIVPEPASKCRMRVGQSMVHWQEGKCVLFDDTYQHEVWNDTDGLRVVLLIDVVRPFPFPISFTNKLTLRLFGWMPAVRNSLRKQREWEESFYERQS